MLFPCCVHGLWKEFPPITDIISFNEPDSENAVLYYMLIAVHFHHPTITPHLSQWIIYIIYAYIFATLWLQSFIVVYFNISQDFIFHIQSFCAFRIPLMVNIKFSSFPFEGIYICLLLVMILIQIEWDLMQFRIPFFDLEVFLYHSLAHRNSIRNVQALSQSWNIFYCLCSFFWWNCVW